jgi:hypothetical protein
LVESVATVGAWLNCLPGKVAFDLETNARTHLKNTRPAVDGLLSKEYRPSKKAPKNVVLAVSRSVLFNLVLIYRIASSHLRPKCYGTLTGLGTPVQIGRKEQVWEVYIHDEDEKPVCVSRCRLAVVDAEE